MTVFFLWMSTVDSIYLVLYFRILVCPYENQCWRVYCQPQSKLDLPTLRQGCRERKNATEQIKIMTLART